MLDLAIAGAVFFAASPARAQSATGRHARHGHASTATPSATLAAIRAGIHARSSTESTMTGRARDAMLLNAPALMAALRVELVVEGGAVTGLRLFGLSPSHPLAALGLQNGDVVSSVGGLPIATPEHALEAYSRLRSATTLPIGITRAGRPMTLTVQVTGS